MKVESSRRPYADAMGLLLSLPVQSDAAPGPVGGVYSNRPTFINDIDESKSPSEYTSLEKLTKYINTIRDIKQHNIYIYKKKANCHDRAN